MCHYHPPLTPTSTRVATEGTFQECATSTHGSSCTLHGELCGAPGRVRVWAGVRVRGGGRRPNAYARPSLPASHSRPGRPPAPLCKGTADRPTRTPLVVTFATAAAAPYQSPLTRLLPRSLLVIRLEAAPRRDWCSALRTSTHLTRLAPSTSQSCMFYVYDL